MNDRILLMKTATTIDEQLALLKSRGMGIADEEKAREILMDVGYYRLGFYWFPYERTYPSKADRDHRFRPGTVFEHAVRLYYFDHDLRSVLSPYLYRIEVNLRTYVTYVVSNYYRENPIWFADKRIVDGGFVDSLPARYETIRRNDAISRHHRKHKSDVYAPAWKTLEYMTFGDMLTLFSALKDEELKLRIVARYDLRNLSVFSSYMNTIRVLRNLCAHGHNVYDLHLQKPIRKGPLADVKGSRTNNIVGCLRVVLYVLGTISVHREEELRYRLNRLLSDPAIRSLKDVIGDLWEFHGE